MTSLNRREFLQVIAVAATSGFNFHSRSSFGVEAESALYAVPRFGNVHFLHFTDCHAQLVPVYFREPAFNIGVGIAENRPPHLVGEALLKHYDFHARSAEAYAFTHLDFDEAARRYGKIGGFAHLATLVKRLRAGRPGVLLL